MRRVFVPVALACASMGSGARADVQTIAFVHLATDQPQETSRALYMFSFISDGEEFQSATVYFNLADGARYGCGVHVNARCTLRAAGQTLKLVGLKNGIQGTFSWFESPKGNNRPTEITIALPAPGDIGRYTSSISPPFPLPEPGPWTMMIAGFGLLGWRARRHCAQRSWLSLLPRRLMPPRTALASRTD